MASQTFIPVLMSTGVGFGIFLVFYWDKKLSFGTIQGTHDAVSK
jgi:hypothetical protein